MIEERDARGAGSGTPRWASGSRTVPGVASRGAPAGDGEPSGGEPLGDGASGGEPLGDGAFDGGPSDGGRVLRAGARSDLVTRLREGAADRVPPALRRVPSHLADGVERPRVVPRAAALAAVVVGLLLSAALVSRALSGPDEHTALPARGPTAATQRVGAGGDGAARETSGATDDPAPGGAASGALGGAAGGSDGSPGAAQTLVLDVAGRVRRPGLVRLAPGSRVWDAVVAAGGPASGARLDRINLARRLVDGEQIVVPGPDDPVASPAPAGTPPGTTPGAAGTVVDLNVATADQLDALPGVGPVLAARILAWRAGHGRFTRVEELREVTGIGDKLFAQLRPLVRV